MYVDSPFRTTAGTGTLSLQGISYYLKFMKLTANSHGRIIPLHPFGALVLWITLVSATPPHAPPSLHVIPCATMRGIPPDAKCAQLRVFENRSKRAGRWLAITLVVLPAHERNAGAIFDLSGGPGQSAIEDAPFVSRRFAPLRKSHDLVLVAQRGTRYSHQLQCDLFANPVSYFKELFPNAPLRQCRSTLAKSADLNQYGTSIAADDLDDVRAALGYDKIALYGGSYGTLAAQVYARRHPSHLRAMLLESVATTDFLIPLPYAGGAQRALDDLFFACAHETRCRRAFPSLPSHFATLLGRFDASGVGVNLRVSKNAQRITLSREVFVDRLRQLLYDPMVARVVPIVIEDAYRGNTTPLASAIFAITQSIAPVISWGMSMSVSCSEDDPFITRSAAIRQSRATFMGTQRIDAQHRACAIWDVKPVDRSYLNPVRSSAPVLMLSGTDDPATPQQYARRQLRYYTNGRLISIPHGGHDNDSPCLDRIRIAFLASANTKAVDASCITAFKRPSFFTTERELHAFFP
ncbi:MAG: alpha/beta fold hydrolase [Candidatus Eremiobacteraeota bacterium]|nr:alpha/beta fold hydrolase [Candidatus Eremiobacteraeota bacterium]